jgi:hypothetical protein
MIGFLVFLIAIAPWIGSGIVAFHSHPSILTIVLVILGAIAGAISIPLSAVYWLQTLHRRTMESQAVGMIFVPVILPFFAYSGSVAGAGLVGILYGYGEPNFSLLFLGIAMGLTVILGGLILPAIAAISATNSDAISIKSNQFIVLPLVAIANGIVSAGLSVFCAYGFIFIVAQLR